MAWRVLVTAREFASTVAARELLEQGGCELVRTSYGSAVGDYDVGEEDLIELLRGVDAFIVGSARVTRRVFERAPQLRIVARRGVGYERIDLAAARDHGVMVTITTGSNSEAVADHVFGLLLAAARRVIEGHRGISEGRFKAETGPELGGKTFGIVGLGRVGKGVARRARGFAMRVVASDPVRDDPFAEEHAVTYVPLARLLAEADIVSLNASLNATTVHLIDRAALAAMKPGVILVNTARGEIVEEAALADALRCGHVRAAGIDVFASEPPVDSPLIGAPNTVLTPHMAAYSDEATARGNLQAARTVIDYLRGIDPRPEDVVSAAGPPA